MVGVGADGSACLLVVHPRWGRLRRRAMIRLRQRHARSFPAKASLYFLPTDIQAASRCRTATRQKKHENRQTRNLSTIGCIFVSIVSSPSLLPFPSSMQFRTQVFGCNSEAKSEILSFWCKIGVGGTSQPPVAMRA